MLVIDDSKMKLLKMKERLLEISAGVDKTALEDYKKLAVEIDSQIYNNLFEKIKNINTHNYSLEEQLVFLNEILQDYEDLYQLRCSFEMIYGRYSTEKLELSDLSNILLDNIKNRKSIVEGYLVNSKNIDNIKKELEKLNFKLIQEENKKDEIGRKVKQLETELRNNILNAEGRIYSDTGSLKYTSIVQEFRDNSLDLKELLSNKTLLEEEFSKINEKEVASSEKLQAAKICYQNMPSSENLLVYHDIDVDAAKVRYKLILLRIATLIAEEAEDYTGALEKRMEIDSLNSVRKECLNKIGIKLSIDSFSRIRLKEQINILQALGDNSKEIAVIRENIDNYNTLIEQRISQNNEFMLTINDNVEFIKDDTSFVNIVEDNNVDVIKVANLTDSNYLNKVIKVSDLSDNFMYDIVKQKTAGVINRVNEVYNGVPVSVSEDITSPELLVVPSSDLDNDDNKDLFNEYDVEAETIDTIDDVFPEKEEDVFLPEIEKSDDVFPSNELDNDDNKDLFNEYDTGNATIDTIDDVFPTNTEDNIFSPKIERDIFSSEQPVVDNTPDTIFNDTIPFESAPLFSDRYDDNIFDAPKETPIAENATTIDIDSEGSKQQDTSVLNNEIVSVNGNEMPELFWPTQEEQVQSVINNNENVLSFDEQINALMNEEPKVKRKVA